MSVEIDDTKRLLSLTTVLGEGALSPIAFAAEECLSAPYSVTIEAVSSDQTITAGKLLYTAACLTVQQGEGKRFFHGMVRSFAASGVPERGMWRYTITLAPRLWFMNQTSDCRIFQQKTVIDILTTLCGEVSQALQTSVLGTPPTLEYVTQYNETDFHFLSRLLQEAGFFYFFTHGASDHTLVVSNQNLAFPADPKPLMAVVFQGSNIDVLHEWRLITQTSTGSVRLMDYDHLPVTMPEATTTVNPAQTGGSARDVMRWPALSTVAAVVTDRTKFAAEAASAEASLIETAGSNHMFMPGGRFTLLRDPFTSTGNVDHVVRAVRHAGSDESWVAGGGKTTYRNSLTVFPMATIWREKQAAQRPQMAGIFAAIVLGESGEEIHSDSLGRIKVRLMWDHRQDTVAGQAVWVRVIQPWAGNAWGWQHLPRVGSEVAVAFMDGDPDRPVVVGGFYNGNNAILFPVPDQATKSGFRSRSSKSGGTSNFSEFSVDDKAGKERMYLHAEKDMTREVENDDKITVGHDQSLTVSHDRTIAVSNDEAKTVSHNQTLSVNNDRTETVSNNASLSVGNNRTEKISNNQSLTIGGTDTADITGNRKVTISQGNDSLSVSMGDLKIDVSLGQVSIEAMMGITLTVGGNSVKIDQSGVTISGIMVKAQGQAMVQVEGPMAQVSGDGMLTLKGGIVMVN